MFLPKLPGLERTMRRSVDWMHKDLPVDPHWEPFFYNSMVYGGLINQVFPRVYSKDKFARIKAKVLLILGEEEAVYNNLQVAIRSAWELIPDVEVALIPDAHHSTCTARKGESQTSAVF